MSDRYTVDVHVRYQDLDTMAHVNNAVYATYLEEARAAYARDVLDLEVEDYSFVIASLEIAFERPVTMTDELQVAIETTALGETSTTMAYELLVDGETVGTGETTLVFVDPDKKQPAPVPTAIRKRIVAFEDLEVEA